MSETKIPIPGRLKNVAVGGHVAGTEDIYDDTAGKTQQQINSTLQAAYEALTQSNVIAVAEADWPVATPAANTIYRVAGASSYTDYMYNADDLTTPIAMATYNNAIDDVPTAGSDNLVKSGGLYAQIGDISSYSQYAWVEKATSVISGYYMPYSMEVTEAANYRYASIPVTAGQTFKISGYNANSNIPLALVYNSQTSAKARLISQSEAGAMVDQEATIPEGYDTLYVNSFGSHTLSARSYELAQTSLVELIEGKEDSVEGKGLSTNDYTDADKAIVDGADDNYMGKMSDYVIQTYTPTDGYFIKYNGESSQEGEGRQYVSFNVLVGERYRILGYNLNTNYPGCRILKSSTGTNDLIFCQSTAQAFNIVVDVEYSGVMYVNGLTSVQAVEIYKYTKVDDDDFFAMIKAASNMGDIVLSSKSIYKYEGGILKIASKYSSGYDIVQEWMYCLQGTLKTIFSFYRVSLYPNTSALPVIPTSTDGREIIFTQSSDCVLATRFNRSDAYASGAASSQYASGNHTFTYNNVDYKTADTVSVNVYADGKEISDGDGGYAEQVDIKVVTNAYDPFVLMESLSLDESNPTYETLFVETMDYRVHHGSIHCIDSRKYKKTAYLEAWGGFASMAFSLPYVYLPCGVAIPDAGTDGFGIPEANIGVNDGQFYKEDYPDFNHIIRRNSTSSVYEVVHLTDYGIGDHSEIPSDYAIGWVYNSSGTATNKKIYHRVTYHKTFNNGDKQRLSCIYNWFTPIANTSNYIVFRVGDLLYIDIKAAFNGTLPLPSDLILANVELVTKSSTLTSYSDINADGIDIVASGEASLILRVI